MDDKPTKGRGVQTILTPEVFDEVVTLIELGDYVETAGAKIGVARHTMLSWLRRGGRAKAGLHRDFVNAVEAAQEVAEQKHLSAIDSAAFGYDVVEEIVTLDREGNQVGPKHVKTTRKLDWKAAAWRLQHKNPKRYAKRSDDDDLVDKDSLNLFMFALIAVLQEELGDKKAERILERMEGELPGEAGQGYIAGQRLEIVYQDNGHNGQAELSADPYLPTLPSSQQDLAGEIPSLGLRPPPGQDPLAGGTGGEKVPE